jgi:hypothetical protein
MFTFVFAILADSAEAQAGSSQGDKAAADKKGVEGVFAGKGLDSSKGPTKQQKWLGIGSLFVAFLVWKFL